MGDLIVLATRKERVLSNNDLTSFLRQAAILSKDTPNADADGLLSIKDKEDLKKLLAVRLFESLKSSGALSTSFFLCSLYVAEVIAKNIKESQLGLWAIDFLLQYQATGKAEFLKKGGDVCFLICAVFPGWAKRRNLNPEYFRGMGSAMYLDFYYQAGQEVTFYMSELFKPMVNITKKSLANL